MEVLVCPFSIDLYFSFFFFIISWFGMVLHYSVILRIPFMSCLSILWPAIPPETESVFIQAANRVQDHCALGISLHVPLLMLVLLLEAARFPYSGCDVPLENFGRIHGQISMHTMNVMRKPFFSVSVAPTTAIVGDGPKDDATTMTIRSRAGHGTKLVFCCH